MEGSKSKESKDEVNRSKKAIRIYHTFHESNKASDDEQQRRREEGEAEEDEEAGDVCGAFHFRFLCLKS